MFSNLTGQFLADRYFCTWGWRLLGWVRSISGLVVSLFRFVAQFFRTFIIFQKFQYLESHNLLEDNNNKFKK